LLLYSSHLPLGVPNGLVIHHASAPTMIIHVGSINSFTHVAHDREALCDSYIVNSIHDATESYYERGKHGLMDLNNIEFPLFMLQFLKLYLFCLPMLFALRFHDLSLYKTIFHRKWFRFKCLSFLLFDALYSLSSYMASLPQALIWRPHEHLCKLLHLAQRR
jgi:hypothetical protein